MVFTMFRGCLAALTACALAPAAGCLPDDPVDDNNPFSDDDDDFTPTQEEDCPVWAPEYKVGFLREYYVEDESDRSATYLGLKEWRGGVYWGDEIVDQDTGDVMAWVYDHCHEGQLYRIGTEEPSGDIGTFNPPVLQLDSILDEGHAWTSEYDLLLRHFTERYEVVGLEDIEIQAGSFEALHIEMRLSYLEDDEPVAIYFDSYYVEELGLVQQSSSSPTYFELTTYDMPEEWR